MKEYLFYIRNRINRFFYKVILKKIFFKIDPEIVHDRMIQTGRFLGSNVLTRGVIAFLFSYSNKRLEQNILGIAFSSPIGLSAGFDKNASLVRIIPNISFGFMQIGTVTFEQYEGNPKPRLYRLPHSKGLVVYYGLKNIGVRKIIEKLKSTKLGNFPLSISFGKTNSSKTATIDDGVNDYYNCLNQLIDQDIGDFYTMNISCPNTFGGEPFTTPEKLSRLMEKICSLNINKPMFLKMPIDLDWDEFNKLLDVAVEFNVDGVIIGNLSKNRDSESIKDKIPSHISGGISGKPTWELSNKLISLTYKNYGDKLVVIGVGGIFSAKDAYEKIKLGASLVQIITGMIYEGPQLISEINQGIVRLLQKDGLSNIKEAIGIDTFRR